MGIERTPVRMPGTYKEFQSWFPRWVRDSAAMADVRNATGVGISISGDAAELALLEIDTGNERTVGALNAQLQALIGVVCDLEIRNRKQVGMIEALAKRIEALEVEY